MLHCTFPKRALRRGFSIAPFILVGTFLTWIGAPAHAGMKVSYTGANSATQGIINDEGEGYAEVDFTIYGGSGSADLVVGTPHLSTVGNSELDQESEYGETVQESGLTICRQFTVDGVTLPLIQTDDLSGGGSFLPGSGDATVDVHAGPTVTFDLGVKGQVDVTPQEYKYDLNANATAPGYQYLLLLRAPASPPASLTLSHPTVTYPASSTGTVTLTVPAPAGGENVALTSSDPTVTVPALVPVPAGKTSVTFPITTSRVDMNTSVTLMATAEQISASAILTVLTRPEFTFFYALADLPEMDYSDPSGADIDFSITGGAGSVALAQGIPSTVSIGTYNLYASTSTDAALSVADVPFSRAFTLGGVTHSLNQSIVSFDLGADECDDVYYNADISPPVQLVYDLGPAGVVTASAPGLNEDFPAQNTPIPVTFELLPPYVAPSSVVVSPGKLYGGNSFTYGRVRLASPAPVGGGIVMLTSSDPSAATVPVFVTVPADGLSMTFPITTYFASADTPVTITAQGNGTASGSFTVLGRYSLSGAISGASGPLSGAKVTATSTGAFTLTSTLLPDATIPGGNLSGITSTLSPRETGTISGLTVGVDVMDTHISDLMLTLTGPDGTSVTLKNPGSSAQQSLDTSYPVLTTPAQSLSAFIGKPVGGNWVLKVVDPANGNGTLNGWNLTFNYNGTVTDTTTTAADGSYLLGLKEGEYMAFPTVSGYTFSPSSQTVFVGPDVSPSDATNINFTSPQ